MNQLDQLRAMTDVVADTGDIEAIARYKPVDATTNPSLLLKAASMPQYDELIARSAEWAKSSAAGKDEQVEALSDKFAVEIGCEILKIVPGRVSTEVDARLSFDTEASVAKARRLIELYADAGIERDRILIRDCVSFPELGDRYFRVAVRTVAENERLLAAMKEF